jgi:hypothetical protein
MVQQSLERGHGKQEPRKSAVQDAFSLSLDTSDTLPNLFDESRVLAQGVCGTTGSDEKANPGALG